MPLICDRAFRPAAQALPVILWTLAKLGGETGMEVKKRSQHTKFFKLYDDFRPEIPVMAIGLRSIPPRRRNPELHCINENAAGDNPDGAMT